jgi:hypothetical protein
MFTMHEELVRVPTPDSESTREARQRQLWRHTVAARRWRRLERLAHAASTRHESASRGTER